MKKNSIVLVLVFGCFAVCTADSLVEERREATRATAVLKAWIIDDLKKTPEQADVIIQSAVGDGSLDRILLVEKISQWVELRKRYVKGVTFGVSAVKISFIRGQSGEEVYNTFKEQGDLLNDDLEDLSKAIRKIEIEIHALRAKILAEGESRSDPKHGAEGKDDSSMRSNP